MRYFKSAAFLLALLSSSATSLSGTANAAEDTSATPQPAEGEAISTDLSSLLNSAQGKPNSALLESFTDETTRLARTTGLASPAVVREPEFSQVPSSSFTSAKTIAQAMNLEGFRRLLQAAPAQPDASAVSQTPQTPSEDNLPTLEEGVPPVENPGPTVPTVPPEGAPAVPPVDGSDSDLAAPSIEAPEGPLIEPPSSDSPPESPGGSPNQPAIEALPDSLLSDPNPLNVPTSRDDVNIEQNPVITLEQAIELAYRNNQTLQTSLLTLDQAEAALQEAKAARLPTASVGAEAINSRQGSTSNTTIGSSARVDYNLLTGGQREAAIRAAELQTQVSALAVESQQEQIRLTTANAYYALQEAGEQIRINQSFVNEAERNLRDSELRQEVGVGTRFDVLRADVQLANAQQQLVQSRFNQDIARRDTSRLLNLPSTSGLQATPVARAESWPLSLDDSILLAFQNRSELEQLLLQSDINEQQRRIALAAIRPQVSLFANYGVSNTLATNATINTLNGPVGAPTGFDDSTSSIGISFNLTLYDGGAARARARQQEIAGAINEEQFSLNLDQVRFDVEQFFFNLQANEENIVTSRVAVTQAEEALNLANLRLQAGVGTQLDVLTAQSDLTQAQFNNVSAILGYNRSLAGLQRAVSNLEL